MNLTIKNFDMNEYNHFNASANPSMVGLMMRKARTETTAQQDIETFIENNACMLDSKHYHRDDVLLDLTDMGLRGQVNREKEGDRQIPALNLHHHVKPIAAGFYSLVFIRCHGIENHYATVEFQLDIDFHNLGPNYLSAGDMALPAIYMVFSVLFGIATFIWCYILHNSTKKGTATVYSIHYVMATLGVVKALSLLFESIRYHYIALVGASELWSIVYYIFTAIKGVMLFMVILLIGSGWSLMKGYLNDREKSIIFIVLLLQVINNAAMVILDETSPGSKAYLLWRDALHIVDILCCCAILFPVLWSIRHLRQAAEVDGKAAEAKVKLELFRKFYIIVISYVYFTRIAVDLIESSIPFYMLWLGPFCSELASLLFFVSTGLQFQPTAFGANSYTAVDTQDGEEMGLRSGSYGSSNLMHGSHGSSPSAAAGDRDRDRHVHKNRVNKQAGMDARDVEMASTSNKNTSGSNTNNSSSSSGQDTKNPMSALELSD